MLKSQFDPCILTRGTTVPAGKDWLHEIKHDGYRLIVQRDGQRVRLWTRNDRDASSRIDEPTLIAGARKAKAPSFLTGLP
jgi:bifunctional non-homologous end joining protein LigD